MLTLVTMLPGLRNPKVCCFVDESIQKTSEPKANFFVCVPICTETWLLYDDDEVTAVPSEEIRKLVGSGGGTTNNLIQYKLPWRIHPY